MHQNIAQRRAILNVLRQRCTLSTAEFYSKTGRHAPITLHRFAVIPNGGNQFGIVERATGAVHQVCTGHGAACHAAQLLEVKPRRQPTFATFMLRWTCAFCVLIGLFALYGALP